jgi:hypothetical protein
MADSRNMILAVLVVAIAVAVFYMIDPTLGGIIGSKPRYEAFADAAANGTQKKAPEHAKGSITSNIALAANGAETAEAVKNAHAVASVPSKAPEGVASGSQESAEGFMNYDPSPMPFAEANKPANCYPKNQLTPQELLPNDPNSKWAQANPMGQGDISGKNFLSAGALVGVNTVGQSLRNANLQLRSEPANPQLQVGPWMQSTIEPDLQRRPLEGF